MVYYDKRISGDLSPKNVGTIVVSIRFLHSEVQHVARLNALYFISGRVASPGLQIQIKVNTEHNDSE